MIELYTKKYSGTKMCFNSRKGSGVLVEGIAVQEIPEIDIVVLRDSNNFPHAVSKLSIKEIE